MHKKELRETNELQERIKKTMLLEKLTFCKYADCYDFNNYFRIGDLKESELLCLVSFLYHKECFQMLLDIMNRYRERFIFPDTTLLQEFEPDEILMERISRIGILADV